MRSGATAHLYRGHGVGGHGCASFGVEIRPITGCTTLSVHPLKSLLSTVFDRGGTPEVPSLLAVDFPVLCWPAGVTCAPSPPSTPLPRNVALDVGPLRPGVRRVASFERAGVIDDRERGIFLPTGDPGPRA